MKITVVSPHRGDAAFAVGQTIGVWLQQGHTVELVSCFTRSESAPYSDAGSLHKNDRMSFVTAVRRREEETWRRRYGSPKLKITELNLKDAPSRLHCAPEQVFNRSSDHSEKVRLKIARAVVQSKAAALVLPLGASGHVDHVSAREIALAAVPSTMPMAFYPELPSSLHVASDALVAAVQELAGSLGIELLQTSVPATQRIARDVALSGRRRMALCYDSQIDDERTTAIASFCDGREPLWSNAAWRSSRELCVPQMP